MVNHQYFVHHRGPCEECGGTGELDNPAWTVIVGDSDLRQPVGWGDEEFAALEREHGPAILVCHRCAGTGQVEDRVLLDQALDGLSQDIDVTPEGERALDLEAWRRYDRFAAAAITAILSGEMGRRLLARAYHMGMPVEPPVTSPVAHRLARAVATAADLVALAMINVAAGVPEAQAAAQGTDYGDSTTWADDNPVSDTDQLRPTQPAAPGSAAASVDPPWASPNLLSGTHTPPPAPQAGLGSLCEDAVDGYEEDPCAG